MTSAAEQFRNQLLKSAEELKVPGHIVPGFIDYILNGREQGSFCMAVVENNLFRAFEKADLVNQQGMSAIVTWLWNYAPTKCWGSPEKVEAWMGHGGIMGKESS